MPASPFLTAARPRQSGGLGAFMSGGLPTSREDERVGAAFMGAPPGNPPGKADPALGPRQFRPPGVDRNGNRQAPPMAPPVQPGSDRVLDRAPAPLSGGLNALMGGPPGMPAGAVEGRGKVPPPPGPTQPDASGVVPPPNTPGYEKSVLPPAMPGAGIAPAPGTAPAPGGPGRLGAFIRQGTGAPSSPSPTPTPGDTTMAAAPRADEVPPPSTAEAQAAPASLRTLMEAAPPPETADATAAGVNLRDLYPGEPPPAPPPPQERPRGSGDDEVITQNLEVPGGEQQPPPLPLGPEPPAEEEFTNYLQKDLPENWWLEDEYKDYFTPSEDGESATLTALPYKEDGTLDVEAYKQMIGNLVGYENPKFNSLMLKLPAMLDKMQSAGPKESKAYQSALKHLMRFVEKMGNHGLDVDVDALINSYGVGSGDGGGPVDPGTVDPDTGDVDLGTIDPSTGAPDWLRNMDPELGKSWLDWLANLQGRDDRQTAIDSFKGLGDLLRDDPTRVAMYDYLSHGPYYTFSEPGIGYDGKPTPGTLEQMKMAGRQQYGQGLTALDQNVRQQAAALGIPTSDLVGAQMGGRSALLGGLLDSERNLDIRNAEQRQKDLQNYFASLNAAQSSLVGPQQAYYGSLAGLISGTPGLAQTGNPLAGVAQFQLMDDLAREGPTKLDRLGAYAGLVGTGLEMLGSGAQIAGQFSGGGGMTGGGGGGY